MRSAIRFGLLFVVLAFSFAFSQDKKPMDHDVYDSWITIRGSSLSPDGKWFQYIYGAFDGDVTMEVVALDGSRSYEIERAATPRFVGSRYLVYSVVPSKAEVAEATRARRRPDEMPKNSLSILDLSTGDIYSREKIRTIRVPDAGTWIAIQPEPPAPPSGQQQQQQQQPEEGTPQKKRNHAVGSEWILLSVETKESVSLEFVDQLVWSNDGSYIVYSTSTRDGNSDGLFMRRIGGEAVPILTGLGRYSSISIHEGTNQVVFFTDRDDYAAETPGLSAYLWKVGDAEARKIADDSMAGIPEGWKISSRGGLSFSGEGSRVLLSTAPVVETPRDETPEAERVVVDIWNWKDPLIQPMQLQQVTAVRNKTYRGFVDLKTGAYRQVETPEIPDVTIPLQSESTWALGSNSAPYAQYVSFDQSYRDVYLIDLRTGRSRLFLEMHAGTMTFSTGGRFLIWWDRGERVWKTHELLTGKQATLGAGFRYPLYNELEDRPQDPSPHGIAGWTPGDERVLIYDRYDIWSFDPTGNEGPVCITGEYGRAWQVDLRVLRIGLEDAFIPLDQALLLKGFNRRNKGDGFYRLEVAKTNRPQALLVDAKRFSNPTKASEANVVTFTRSDFDEFPDIWTSDMNFSNPKKLTDVGKQLDQYNWGKSELFEWTSLMGEKLQGVLYLPDGFSLFKNYPMIVYFYERLSDNLHNFYHPSPGSGSINISFYVSRGYVVFTPDVPYRIGYPGQSAMHAILPGVQNLIERGFVDAKKIGIQGHSWGGYQIAYMITQTDMFACAEAGAPVSNMISAYGGIRWQTGMSRQFQYERTQSRIGGTIWEKPLQFIENSPVFWADKVNTPLLMLHNDQDGAVPWYQGIEYYMALRRLSKPVWMLNYNGEGHGLSRRPNQKDWAIRMQQFFDHYLKGAPMPVWMAEGVPAIEKGRNLGLDLVGGGK
jgi:dienelactone hydrolase